MVLFTSIIKQKFKMKSTIENQIKYSMNVLYIRFKEEVSSECLYIRESIELKLQFEKSTFFRVENLL